MGARNVLSASVAPRTSENRVACGGGRERRPAPKAPRPGWWCAANCRNSARRRGEGGHSLWWGVLLLPYLAGWLMALAGGVAGLVRFCKGRPAAHA